MSTFNKTGYEKVAKAMQRARERGFMDTNEHAVAAWEHIRDELEAMFSVDNSAFKRDRFREACLPGRNVRARTA